MVVRVSDTKRAHGQFFTRGNPFDHPAFARWAAGARLPEVRILEPFAGANSLIEHLTGMGLCSSYASFDIEPRAADVLPRDTLRCFPQGYEVCVTNPPWLAKNLATFRRLPYRGVGYDDLYKFALDRCLAHCGWVAALIPESFIRADLFRERLTDFISLPHHLFEETKHPVGMALFGPGGTARVGLWSGPDYIGELAEMEAMRPTANPGGPSVRFNEPDGNIGLIALDNTKEASIRFCRAGELDGYAVKSTGRHITRITVEGSPPPSPRTLARWNAYLAEFRDRTRDVLMTCYRGVRKDGRYRRRLDWDLARGIIHHA